MHAAEGYARVSGKPGSLLRHQDRERQTFVTGLADAMIDSLPLVVFTGQVATSVIGSDAFPGSGGHFRNYNAGYKTQLSGPPAGRSAAHH
ncbi:thiamine pyrophosphate-binding protein [Streptomyces sp. GTA36]